MWCPRSPRAWARSFILKFSGQKYWVTMQICRPPVAEAERVLFPRRSHVMRGIVGDCRRGGVEVPDSARYRAARAAGFEGLVQRIPGNSSPATVALWLVLGSTRRPD